MPRYLPIKCPKCDNKTFTWKYAKAVTDVPLTVTCTKCKAVISTDAN